MRGDQESFAPEQHYPCTPNNRDDFRLPSTKEFWVVPLQQVALIEGPPVLQGLTNPSHDDAASSITAVIPFSISRIQVLPVLCAAWHGPVSVALHVPLVDNRVRLPDHELRNASVKAVEQHMRDFVARLPGMQVRWG